MIIICWYLLGERRGGKEEGFESDYKFGFLPSIFHYYRRLKMSQQDSQPFVYEQLKQMKSTGSRLTINGRFVLCSLKEHHSEYNFYQGIDAEKAKWVNVYIKLKSNTFALSKGVAEGIRNQVCPKMIEAGEVELSNGRYCYEVQERTGPSLDSIFRDLRRQLKGKELLHLLLQILKLVEKIDSLRLMSGELDPRMIVFDRNPKKNQISLLNCFGLKRKNSEGKVKQSKYSSRGAHLGRKIGVMDDLESVCYILIDAYTQGQFLADKEIGDYLQEKLSLKAQNFAQNLPQPFLDFYYYVTSLNCGDQVNFYYWKSYISKFISKEMMNSPYGFFLAKIDKNREIKKIKDTSELCETMEDSEEQKEMLMYKLQRMIVKNMIKER